MLAKMQREGIIEPFSQYSRAEESEESKKVETVATDPSITDMVIAEKRQRSAEPPESEQKQNR